MSAPEDAGRFSRLVEKHLEDAANHFDGDEYVGGYDVWRAIAAEYYGVEPDAVTTEQRGLVKSRAFGQAWGVD